jgi:hypothetical protein
MSVYRNKGYFTPEPRGLVDRLKRPAIGLAWTTFLVGGVVIAAVCAADLLGML